MLTDERRTELSDVLRPAAPPREIDDVYTDDQRRAPARRGSQRGPVEADHRPALRLGRGTDGHDERHVPRGLHSVAGPVPHPDVPRLPRQLRRGALPRTARRASTTRRS